MGMYELSATTLELLNNVPKPLPFSSFDVPSSTVIRFYVALGFLYASC